MAVRSKLLAAGRGLVTNAVVDVYVAPAGTTGIVKTLTLANTSGAAQTYRVRLRAPSGLSPIVALGTLADGAERHFVGWDLVVPAAHALALFVVGPGGAGTVDVHWTASGAQLVGVAP